MFEFKKNIQNQRDKRFYKYEDFRDKSFIIIAEPLSILFYKLGFNSTFITLLSGLCSILGGLLLTLDNKLIILLSMIFFVFYYLLDYCDGILARLRNEQSTGGQYLDSIMHIVTELSFVLGLSFGSILKDGRYFLPFAFLSVIASSLTFSRFAMAWMSICMAICEKKQVNNIDTKLVTQNKAKPFILKVIIRLGSLIFHEDYFIFIVPVFFFLNIFYSDFLFLDIRTIILIYGSIVYLPAMILDIMFYKKFKIDKIYSYFSDPNYLPKLPDFIYLKDD